MKFIFVLCYTVTLNKNMMFTMAAIAAENKYEAIGKLYERLQKDFPNADIVINKNAVIKLLGDYKIV